MKTVAVNVYQFDELSDQAKEKAREWMRRCVGEDYSWADFIEEDAKSVGLKITGWDLDRGSSCSLEFEKSHNEVADLILENHGEMCGTWIAAKAYRDEVDRAIAQDEHNGGQDAMDAASETFEKALEAEYLDMLRKEWEHALSDEAIDENIRANDYDFTEDGKRTTITE